MLGKKKTDSETFIHKNIFLLIINRTDNSVSLLLDCVRKTYSEL